MRWFFAAVTVLGIFLLLETAGASDLRVVSRKAQAAYEAAQAHARASQDWILQDRGALAKAVADAKTQRDALQARLLYQREEQSKLEDQEAEMVAKAAGAKTDLAGYAGVVRQTARDLKMLLAHSHFTAGNPLRTDILDEVTGPDHFPGLETVVNLADLFFEEMGMTGGWIGLKVFLSISTVCPERNVLKAGLGAMNEARATLENILQEAILKELPRLERFLPTLNVMAAVAPLLGLLGTVTGMIGTFQVITLYGTGDPRLMAGGISEALVTTMVGLAVAIPVMLVHTFLKRRVEHIVGDMEEKALALSNIICRECNLKNTATSLPAGVFP